VKIFLAGAAGAIGRRLVPLLLGAGHDVIGTTRTAARAAALRANGVVPVVLDVFDAGAVRAALGNARPDVVVHQLTDLPAGLPPERMAEGIERNARIRREGTAHIVAAALDAGVRRLIAQSIAWAYAPGPLPLDESAPLDVGAEGSRAVTVGGVAALERLVTGTPGFAGLALRYGRLYGPGTGAETPGEAPTVHVDAAAWAAVRARGQGTPGAYNITDDGPGLSNARARHELGWDPAFRLPADAARPADV
jgi:nucleoside-diphosphate-sugar epimerase